MSSKRPCWTFHGQQKIHERTWKLWRLNIPKSCTVFFLCIQPTCCDVFEFKEKTLDVFCHQIPQNEKSNGALEYSAFHKSTMLFPVLVEDIGQTKAQEKYLKSKETKRKRWIKRWLSHGSWCLSTTATTVSPGHILTLLKHPYDAMDGSTVTCKVNPI